MSPYETDPCAFIDAFVKYSELAKPFSLLPHQREQFRTSFQFDGAGKLKHETIVWSKPKKGAKTFENALVCLWWAFTQEAPNEVLVLANDLEQAVGRVFSTIARLIENNVALGQSARVGQKEIVLSNGTKILALASEYAGAAGSNHGLCSLDELWAFSSERARRLYEELTPVPTRKNSIRLITSTAGIVGESELLWGLYVQGVGKEEHRDGQGARMLGELPIYENAEARLLTLWDHTPRTPWQDADYYRTQKRSLRSQTFARLHENRWVASTSSFISGEAWDGCVDRELRPLIGTDKHQQLFIGVDASVKHDNSACVAVRWDHTRERLLLSQHRIWQPSYWRPLDLEHTIEAWLKDLHSRFDVRDVFYDPYQMSRSAATLSRAGIRMTEYPQTTARLTQMAEALLDLLKGQNLVLYRSKELREHALNAVAVESTRGWRLAKEKSNRKIDSTVALAMACVGALEAGKTPVHEPGFDGISFDGEQDRHHDAVYEEEYAWRPRLTSTRRERIFGRDLPESVGRLERSRR